MIQANDLKIGNRFIREIPSTRGQEFDHDFVLTEEWMGKLFSENTSFALNDLHPIPLTPEILKINKFVFDIATGTYWLNMSTHYLELLPAGGYWWPAYTSIPEMSSESEQRVSFCRIQSVHQLQNLYHALTGQELEINLT